FIVLVPDLRLLATRAESLGIADRVEIAGSIERRVVLDRMRRASCLLFPSFHDSAGFVVSEALSLGLPVVCLDHAGPGQLVRSWPDVPSFAVPPTNREETVEALASAVRGFVGRPAPVPDEVVATSRPLQAALAEAYRTALASAAAP
ncbi:MAG: glycosyltransferase, partial [Acidimicrobiia bacterium]